MSNDLSVDLSPEFLNCFQPRYKTICNGQTKLYHAEGCGPQEIQCFASSQYTREVTPPTPSTFCQSEVLIAEVLRRPKENIVDSKAAYRVVLRKEWSECRIYSVEKVVKIDWLV